MLGFMNTTTIRQKKNGFQFAPLNRTYAVPSKTITTPPAGDAVALSDLTGFDVSSTGMAFAMRFFNDNWDVYADELMITIGNASDYIYLQKRKSGLKFRWGIVAGGVIQLIDDFTINHLHDGNHTIGMSVTSDRFMVCVNGCMVGYQTTGITVPAITSLDNVYVGKFYNGSFPVNANMTFDHIKVWANALSQTELENVTFEAEPIVGATKDNNLWTIVKAGQSNSLSDDDSGVPSGLTYANPTRMKMMNKDFTIRAYADPYATTSYGNMFGAFIESGNFSGVGVTLDRLAARYGDKSFMSLPCNRGNTGLIVDGGAGFLGDGTGVVQTTGDGKRISSYAFVAYQSMLLTMQRANLLALEWYQGETDATDGSGVSEADYKNALADLFDRWRNVLPPIRVIVGLCEAPVSGYANWSTIQDAQANFVYDNTYHVSADGFEVNVTEPYHLTGNGQYTLGEVVATQIIAVNQ